MPEFVDGYFDASSQAGDRRIKIDVRVRLDHAVRRARFRAGVVAASPAALTGSMFDVTSAPKGVLSPANQQALWNA
jgi:hypothetical protein